jgi:hypothetical protein
MTKSEAVNEIVSAITRIQEQSGDGVPVLTRDTDVINGVEGFDSLRGLELTVEMTRYFEIPDDENICISEDGKRALTIDEIAERLMAKTQKNQREE